MAELTEMEIIPGIIIPVIKLSVTAEEFEEQLRSEIAAQQAEQYAQQAAATLQEVEETGAALLADAEDAALEAQEWALVAEEAGGTDIFTTVVALPVASWSGDAAPFTQNVAVPGILADTTVQNVRINAVETDENREAVDTAGVVCSAVADGSLTFTALYSKPTVEVSFMVEFYEVEFVEVGT